MKNVILIVSFFVMPLVGQAARESVKIDFNKMIAKNQTQQNRLSHDLVRLREKDGYLPAHRKTNTAKVVLGSESGSRAE